ncbi:MAG: GHKL domain-containing protein [Oliverpabstia sp.]
MAAKIFHCRKNHIQITCVADGKLLDFIHVTDLCSIFGNALDNAIEHVIMIPEAEKD